ncbi:M81 family metallopeptidase [Variovorax saccharolyticus]|uniref:M81 family metallopeptidase n=1 Tax=Variovorax saccharolyticus TaxID=3053516 RepID=UPI0025777B34|nr:M81 family metallopeptidase [Variovorax sp. J22R187]MDM0020249.1 M81 family metallopeptidase [Variovorax sp. J22R187]
MNIFIAGFQHETNTFAPSKADWAAFQLGESFPPYREGPEVIEAYGGQNIPIGGFIDSARERGWGLIASAWAGATPSAHVTEDAFERIAGVIARDLSQAHAQGSVDAVFLDLHGAAVGEHLEDLEGELLGRLRAIVGQAVPIVATLDLHANVSRRMLHEADALVAYRTYPHVDSADTGRLAAELLARRIARGVRESLQVRRLAFLLPLNVQCTMVEPAASVYQLLRDLDAQHGTVLSFATGFPAADIAECGPVVWGYGDAADVAVQALFARIDSPRAQWRLDVLPPREAVAAALTIAEGADRPVVIADTQDNPGAGSNSNTTGMLRALLAEGAGERHPGRVALGLLFDPAAAAAAHAAGLGARIEISLGTEVATWAGQRSDPPVRGVFTVRALSDGDLLLKGPMSWGSVVSVGPSACLEIDGVLVAVASGKSQMLDRELFRFVGIEPESMKLLVAKSSVHFRADFAPIASRILVAKAAGPMAADPADLPWTRLPATMALRP